MNKLRWLVAAWCFALIAPCYAALMSDSVPGTGTLRNDNTSGTGFSTVRVSSPTFNGRAGMYTGYFYPGSLEPDSFFRFFCIEIAQTAVGSATYQASLWDHEELQRLFDVAFPNKWIGDFYDGGITDFGAFGSAAAGAAFQLAVWELMFDPGDRDLAGGSFHVTSGSPAAVTALAQGWLDTLDASTTWQNWTLYRFTNDRRQDYVSATFRIPEPRSLALLGLGLLLFARVARRR